ncbi:MAG: hypothetical protein V2I57_09140 [Xanthomonadales bacterium]|jgi:hypothetical protein|nr:hypothetical protein [Xanthomonadales bacterium]
MTSAESGAPSGDASVAAFVALSSALTGYEETTLWGTGMARVYHDFVAEALDPGELERLLRNSSPVDRMMQGAHGGELRAIIKLWYLGTWQVGPFPTDGSVTYPIAPQAYVEALAWKAMGGHPQGAKQPGYASWTVPPVGVSHDDKDAAP